MVIEHIHNQLRTTEPIYMTFSVLDASVLEYKGLPTKKSSLLPDDLSDWHFGGFFIYLFF